MHGKEEKREDENNDVDDVGETGVSEGEEVTVEDGGVENEERKECGGVMMVEEDEEDEGNGVP